MAIPRTLGKIIWAGGFAQDAPPQQLQDDTVGTAEAKIKDEVCTEALLAPQLAVVRNNFNFNFMYPDCVLSSAHNLHKPLYLLSALNVVNLYFHLAFTLTWVVVRVVWR